MQAHTVMVGPKFASLTPDEKQRALKYLTTYVFVPPSDEPWEPDQTVLIVESATGVPNQAVRRLAVEAGRKLPE